MLKKEFPDLAIEVIATSGGIDSLAIYQRLQIPEVWFWQNNSLVIYCLVNDQYQQQFQSQLLPNLNVSRLISCVQESDFNTAIAQFCQT